MRERIGSVPADVAEVDAPVATAVLLHGLGEAAWFWEPWLPLFRNARLRVVAPDLPGHGEERGDPSLDDVVSAARSVVDAQRGPVVLVGHSMGGLVAQLLGVDREFHAVGLLSPLPVGQVRVVPGRRELLSALRMAPALASGRPISVPYEDYRAGGLAQMEESAARSFYARITPWPNRLVRDLVRRPVIDPLKVTSPVLIAMGKLDRIIPWQQGRILADLYEGVAWRYDGLGHCAPWEPGGERLGRDFVKFCVEPVRPVVIESEGFMPTEGAGHTLRRARRGELMKKRSAYGQKESAR